MVSYPNGQIDPDDFESQREKDLQAELDRHQEAVGKIKVTLTKQHRDLLNFVEHYWYQNQTYPSLAALQRWAVGTDLPFTKARQLELDLVGYLSARGIAPSKADSRLSDEQLAAANLILNYTDRRSKARKLEALGITPTKWDGWLRDKTFKEYLNNRTGAMLDNNTDVAHTGLLGAVERGESQALKLYYEMTGLYRADSPQANINVIMTLLIEVIQREVNDPDVLRRIAAGFELVMLRQATGLSASPPTASSGPIAGIGAGQPLTLDVVETPQEAANVRVSSQNPPSQRASFPLEL